jgi:hypothetical protein
VEGNHLIHEATKHLTITMEGNKKEVAVFVGVRARTDFQAKFNFLENNQGRNEQVADINSIDAKAVLLPSVDQDQSNMEEFDFDILFDKNLGVWSSTLVTGSYLITVKSRAFKEFNTVVPVKLGEENEFDFELLPLNQNVPEVLVSAVNIFSEQPVKNTHIEYRREGQKTGEEGLTNSDGIFGFKVPYTGRHKVILHKTGF